ncbi:MAG: 16S rRNA (uracil(1498)-N(3))-methyltransferase [Oscillospiraceae bacterium]|nr:16S rRNA (uracil(1498)-N(3))-methyltransferase [Oscillospiraceae bacterium]
MFARKSGILQSDKYYVKKGVNAVPRFFIDNICGDTAVITGQDAVHIRRSLRMHVGDNLTLCDGMGNDYYCELTALDGDEITVKVLYCTPTASEPSTAVTLYQGLPKGDKMDLIIQKSVELGVAAIVPVETARSIARVDSSEKAEKKRGRWQKIADEAAGQSGRGILPRVTQPISFKLALERMRMQGVPVIVFYEGGGQPILSLIDRDSKELAVVIGPEGGFEPSEIDQLQKLGAKTATLGPRVLRCETAPIAALSVIMALTGNME